MNEAFCTTSWKRRAVQRAGICSSNGPHLPQHGNVVMHRSQRQQGSGRPHCMRALNPGHATRSACPLLLSQSVRRMERERTANTSAAMHSSRKVRARMLNNSTLQARAWAFGSADMRHLVCSSDLEVPASPPLNRLRRPCTEGVRVLATMSWAHICCRCYDRGAGVARCWLCSC